MLFNLILHGLAAGFMLAAPVGPVGVLCIRRTLAEGRLIGLVSGIGAATADAIFGGVVAFGVTWVADLLETRVVLLQFVGGAFLCFLGIRTYLAKPAKTDRPDSFSNLLSAYGTTFFLTIINPLTMFGFAAFFTTLGVFQGGASILYAGSLVAAVFVGSAGWWLGIVVVASMMRNKLEMRHLLWLNRFVGLLISGFGALALMQLMWSGQNVMAALYSG